MDILKLSYCQCCFFSVFFGLLGQIPLAAESAIPVFPDIPNDLTSKEPLVVQLVASSDRCVHYKPVDFYVRLNNRGKETLEVFLESPESIFADTVVENIPRNCLVYRDRISGPNKSDDLKWSNRDRTSIILMQNQSLIIEMPRCFLNKDTSVFVKYYTIAAQGNGYGEKKISSNSVPITIEDRALRKEEIEEIQNDCRRLLESISKNNNEEYRKKNAYANDESQLLVFYSPHSLPVLKDYLENSPLPAVRDLSASVLIRIARKDPTSTTSQSIAKILISRMTVEEDDRVRINLICFSLSFEDIVTNAQKEKRRFLLFELLKRETGISMDAANCLVYLPLTVEEKQELEKRLNNPSWIKSGFSNYIKSLIKENEKSSEKKKHD